MPITPVIKIGQACVLACLESFFLDNGINLAQQDLINRLYPKGSCNHDGIVYDFDKVAKELSLAVIQIASELPVRDTLNKGEAILFFLEGDDKGQGRHCIRFSKNATNGIEAMNPDSGCFEFYNYHRLNCGMPTGPLFKVFKISVLKS